MAGGRTTIDAWTLHGPSSCDLDRREVETVLRGLLDPRRGVPSTATVTPRQELATLVLAVDSEAWIRWSLDGLALFSRCLPTLRQTRDTAERVLLGIVLTRSGGNLSATSRVVGKARKPLRDTLRRLDWYPLPTAVAAPWDYPTDPSGSEIQRQAQAALAAIRTVAPFAAPTDVAILSRATKALTRVILAAVLTERG